MSEATTELSIGAILTGLKELRTQPDDADRSGKAWRLVARAYGLPEAGPVIDFAQEHGLVRSCADYEGGADGSPRNPLLWANPLDGSEMVWIPAGPYIVGRDKERRRIVSKGFSLGRYPVTNEQYARFHDEAGHQSFEGPDEGYLAHWTNGSIPTGLERHPVVYVSFLDALAYCRWAGLIMPTEWLWEKAARGPDGRSYPWGQESPEKSSVPLANVRSEGTTPVDAFPRTRTPYGCEDMIGNVSEWCQTMKGGDLGRIPDDWPDTTAALKGETVHAALRGSAFLRRNGERMAACHQRILGMTRRNSWVGFRPACFLPCMPAR